MNRQDAEKIVAALVTRLALLLALVVGIAPPLGYWFFASQKVESQLDSLLRLQSYAVAGFITSYPDMWDVSIGRLRDRLERNLAPEESFRICDAAGTVILEFSRPEAGPRLTRSLPIHDYGRVVGRMEVQRPILDQVLACLAVLGASAGFAWIVWGPMRRIPLAALAASETMYRTLFESAPDAILVLGNQGGVGRDPEVSLAESIILDANAVFEAVTGYPAQEAVGRRMGELRLWDDPAQAGRFMALLAQEGKVVDFEFLLRRKDGVLRNALVSSQPAEIAGDSCLISTLRDITDLKLMQQALVQTEKMVSLGGLTAGVAHEINNPLGIIYQSAMNMHRRLDPELPANQKEAKALGIELDAVWEYMHNRNILSQIEGVVEAVQRAAEIVRSMQSFSRLSNAAMLDKDLNDLVRGAVSLAEKEHGHKNNGDFKRIAMRLELDEALPPTTCAPSEIEQVLQSLLRNAAQAMAEAKTPAPAITVRTRRSGGHAVMEVEDNGPGIPADQLRRVFDPFYTTRRVGEGAGLGLYVSYFIITTTHRGEMSASSTPGQGARFTIRLPLAG